MRMFLKNYLYLFLKIVAEGLESVVLDILGVLDFWLLKEKSEEELVKELKFVEEGNVGIGGKYNFFGFYDEVFDGALELIEGDVDMEEEEK